MHFFFDNNAVRIPQWNNKAKFYGKQHLHLKWIYSSNFSGKSQEFFSGGVETAHEWKSIMVFFCSLLVENTRIKNGFPSFTWVRHDVTI